MFKFVVLCAFLAAAAAEPGIISAPLSYTSIGAPLAYNGAFTPATTYISPAGSYIAPTVYSTPYGYSHLIKKRSAIAYNGYIAPTGYVAPTSYVASSPLATTYTSSAPIYSYPLSSPYYTTAAHFIKKRSAPLAYPATYIAPTTYAASSPYLTTAYSTPLYTTPYVSTAPLAYPAAHLIKKRSVAYTAPAAVSHQSRVDYTGPVVSSYAAVGSLGYAPASPISYSAAAPIGYSAPIAYTSSYAGNIAL